MLSEFFEVYRSNVLGHDQTFKSPYGPQKLIYADWTASGRIYAPIETRLREEIMPYVANTHTETTITGTLMTTAYKEAKKIIKDHVHADEHDVLIFSGSGMTGAISKLQRILGFKIPERALLYLNPNGKDPSLHKLVPPSHKKPVVFITHMEHHSNHTSWLETVADVEIINPDEHGLVDLNHFAVLLETYAQRDLKIAAVTACSNVTGIQPPYQQISKMIHQAGGYCFVDFACSAPYVDINMHPEDELERLDAIYFSPHKFLGGPGTPGVLIFNKSLYTNRIPDQPGGGTVKFTNPWHFHDYLDDIEDREDGGTPPFLPGIKAAMAVKLKEQMGTQNMLDREHLMLGYIFRRLKSLPRVHILAGEQENRMGVIAFYMDNMHYNLIVRLLNDRFGIQVRGGCVCAGTYGHYLLNINPEKSRTIYEELVDGNYSLKPGWVRLSIHPVMSDEELTYIMDAIESIHNEGLSWSKDYTYDYHTNEFTHRDYDDSLPMVSVNHWFQDALV